MLDWLFGRKKQQPQPKPKKSQKEEEAEDKWMYDFMIQFLSSPLWRVSLLDFVDNKCIVFDNEEENKFQYTVIHNEFKELVGTLVDGMMEQIGMSQQKLAQIIEKGFQSKQKKLFNQLLLADDFLRFKDLMVKRNKALEQQALKALQESQVKSSNKQRKIIDNEAENQLIRESQRLQQQRQRKLQEQEQQMVRKAIEMSKISSKESQAIKQLEEKATDRIQQEKIKQESLPQKQKDQKSELNFQQKPSKLQSLKSTQQTVKNTQLSDLPPLKSTLNRKLKNQEQFPTKSIQKVEELKQPTKQVQQKQIIQKVQEKPQVQSMQDRKQRLLAQRQKIRKQKQEERKKQLELQTQSKEKLSQPQVHTIVLQQDGFYDQNTAKKQTVVVGESTGVSEEELRRRKELMNKIKNRIIDDF